MSFDTVNLLGVIAAAVSGFVFGAAYYMTLGNRWAAALGKTKADFEGQGMAGPMVVSGLSQIVIALMLTGLIGHLAAVSIKGGLLTAISLWLGFTATTVTVNYVWQRARPSLTVIDGSHWLGVFLLQGLVIGAIGL